MISMAFIGKTSSLVYQVRIHTRWLTERLGKIVTTIGERKQFHRWLSSFLSQFSLCCSNETIKRLSCLLVFSFIVIPVFDVVVVRVLVVVLAVIFLQRATVTIKPAPRKELKPG